MAAASVPHTLDKVQGIATMQNRGRRPGETPQVGAMPDTA